VVRVIAWSVAVVALIAGVLVLRAATMTVHDDPRPGSATRVVYRVETRGGPGALALSRALLETCETRVSHDRTDEGPRELGDQRYEAILRPALDRFDRREFEGCLEDRTISHVQGVVEGFDTIDP
jgi:hypothetical protein